MDDEHTDEFVHFGIYSIIFRTDDISFIDQKKSDNRRPEFIFLDIAFDFQRLPSVLVQRHQHVRFAYSIFGGESVFIYSVLHRDFVQKIQRNPNRKCAAFLF